MNVIKEFLNSEKAVASGVLVVAASGMVIAGHLTPQEWMSYTQTLLGIYVGGKTVQGAVASLGNGKAEIVEAKHNEAKAVASLEELRGWISDNDAAADASLNAKFPTNADVVGDEPTDPGKKIPSKESL